MIINMESKSQLELESPESSLMSDESMMDVELLLADMILYSPPALALVPA